MRFAFVSTMEGVAWGGSEELWSQTAMRLASRKHDVFASVKAFDRLPSSIRKLQQSGVDVQFRSDAAGPLMKRSIVALTSSFAWRRHRWERRRWLKKIKPDLVCVSDGGIAGGLAWLDDCNRLGIPYVALGQANYEGWWPNDRLAEQLREAFNHAAGCFFVSRANLALFEDQIATKLSRAEIVRNPFNVPWDLQPTWPALDKTNGLWSLACVARYYPAAKGQDLLIRLMAQPEWRDQAIQIDCYGAGESEQGLRAMAAAAGVAHKVRFVGQVDDIAKVWENHHALILASRYEGLPLAVVEAMICHRPIIATAVAGTPELVDDGATGFLASAATVPHLHGALHRAWQVREQWPQIGICAGQAIRGQVPRDPAEVFAARLSQIAEHISYGSA